MTRHVALYLRLSPRPDGSYEGVDLQERWGRDYAAAAWPDLPVEVFADKGISAANGDHRPEFERLRVWLADGQVAHLWAVEQTRLERRESEWFQLAAELDAAGVAELHTNRDGIVRVRDDVAGIKAVLAAGEVRRLKRRINDRLAENAARGEPAGGYRFGYRRAVNDQGAKTLVIHDAEAEVIRECADRILAGWSLNAIVKDLDRRKVRGQQGGKVSPRAVQCWLRSPTIAGHRVHQGRIVGRGNWTAILEEDTWQAVKAKLSQPRRVKRADGNGTTELTAKYFGHSSGRRYLLTGGIAACGKCGAPLAGQRKKFGTADAVGYLLCKSPAAGGCSGVGIVAEKSERYVIDTLFAELDKPEFLDAVGADDHGQQRDQITGKLTALEARRNELAETWADGSLTASEWQTARRALAEHEQRLRVELAAIPPPMANVDIATAREAWPAMELDEKREFLRLFIDRVTVHPGSRWTPIDERVAIEWRTL